MTKILDELKISYWLVTHKLFLRKILISSIIILDISLIVFPLYFLAQTLSQNKNYRQSLQSMTAFNWSTPTLHQSFSPAPLQFGSSQNFPQADDNATDVLVEVTNPNQNWAVTEIIYSFPGLAEQDFRSFILPQQTKYLTAWRITQPVAGAQIIIKEIKWRRLTAEFTLPDVNFSFTDLELKNYIDQNLTITRLTAKIKNNSIFNFWQVPLNIVALNRRQPIAVNHLYLDQIDSQEEKQFTVTWPGQNFLTADIQILPELNIFNPDSYRQSKISPGEIK